MEGTSLLEDMEVEAEVAGLAIVDESMRNAESRMDVDEAPMPTLGDDAEEEAHGVDPPSLPSLSNRMGYISTDTEDEAEVGGFVAAILAAANVMRRRNRARRRQRRRRIPNRQPRHPENVGIRKLRDNPYESEWWRLLEKESLRDPNSREAKDFRRDFRVPFAIYDYVYEEAKQAKKGDGETLLWPKRDALDQPTHPLSLKVLSAFHILGHGESFRSVEGRTGIDEDTIRTFFHQFTEWMVQRFYEEFVNIPYNLQLDSIVADYECQGLPGAAGSMDCVHIPWDQCPYEYRIMNKSGKDGYPTRVYEVTVSHDRYIRSIAGSFPGAWNDKSIARFGLVRRMRGGEPRFVEYEFDLLGPDGNPVRHRGLYLITDNGYHCWRELIPPMRVTTSEDEIKWSKLVESVRKDVECTFGSLKKRFKILKIPILYHTVERVDNVFFTCAILHNMLLKWDGYGLEEMENDEEEQGFGDLGDGVVGDGNKRAGNASGYRKQTLHARYDATKVGRDEMLCHFMGNAPVDATLVEQDSDFVSFRTKLVNHYAAVRAEWHRASLG